MTTENVFDLHQQSLVLICADFGPTIGLIPNSAEIIFEF